MKTKLSIMLLALVLCAGAFLSPLTVYADGGNDTAPPVLEVTPDGDMLSVSASDDISGVEAVYIDENRVNSLADGKATVILKDYAGTDKKISVYAVDYAGNRSEAKTLDNPYYKEPAAQEIPVQSAAPAAETQRPAPQNTAAVTQPRENSQAQATSSAQAANTTENETVSSVPEGAFTPEGTGTVLDRSTGTDGDKQFYTIKTEAGNIFYLIIDGKRDNNNVYFLNGVTESDLMALAEKDGNASVSSVPPVETCICTDKCEAGHVNTDCPICKNDLTKCKGKAPEAAPSENEPEPGQGKNSDMGTILFLIAAVLAVGGVGYYVKIVRPRKQNGFDEDEGFEEEDPDESFDRYDDGEFLPEDDIDEDQGGE